MDRGNTLEESLREASAVGDLNTVRALIDLGIDVNARHGINGWTPLHWACKRNRFDVTTLLLQSGADKNAVSSLGQTPSALTKDPKILQLLSRFPINSMLNEDIKSHVIKSLRKPSLNYQFDFESCEKEKPGYSPLTISANMYEDDLILKIRVANASDPDFIEVDIPRYSLSYQTLVQTCCKELGINESEILKLRKLPNTKLRKDKEVQRLKNFEEIEVVTNITNTNKDVQQSNGMAVHVTPSNNYQSISQKDQTVLY